MSHLVLVGTGWGVPRPHGRAVPVGPVRRGGRVRRGPVELLGAGNRGCPRTQGHAHAQRIVARCSTRAAAVGPGLEGESRGVHMLSARTGELCCSRGHDGPMLRHGHTGAAVASVRACLLLLQLLLLLLQAHQAQVRALVHLGLAMHGPPVCAHVRHEAGLRSHRVCVTGGTHWPLPIGPPTAPSATARRAHGNATVLRRAAAAAPGLLVIPHARPHPRPTAHVLAGTEAGSGFGTHRHSPAPAAGRRGREHGQQLPQVVHRTHTLVASSWQRDRQLGVPEPVITRLARWQLGTAWTPVCCRSCCGRCSCRRGSP